MNSFWLFLVNDSLKPKPMFDSDKVAYNRFVELKQCSLIHLAMFVLWGIAQELVLSTQLR